LINNMAIKHITKEEYQQMFGKPYEGESGGAVSGTGEVSSGTMPDSSEKSFLASLLNPVRMIGAQGASAYRQIAQGESADEASRPVKMPGILGGGEQTPLNPNDPFGKNLAKSAGGGLDVASYFVGAGEAKALLKGTAPSVMRSFAKERIGAGLKTYGKKAVQLSPISALYSAGKGLEGEQTPEEALTGAFTGILTMPVFAGIFERGFKVLGKGLKGTAKLLSSEGGTAVAEGVDSKTAAQKNIDSIYTIFRKKPLLNKMETMAGVSPDSNFGHSIGEYAPKIKSDKGFARTADAVKSVNEDIASLYGTKELILVIQIEHFLSLNSNRPMTKYLTVMLIKNT